MYILDKYHQPTGRFLSNTSLRSFLLAWAVLISFMAALTCGIARIGAPTLNGRVCDSLVFLDGAWRILNGQTPHTGFFSHIGSFPYYLTALGMKLGHPSFSALALGCMILTLAVSVGAMTLLTRRTSALYALLMSLFIGLLAATPRPLGDFYDRIDYAMLYNRFGEAFLALLALILFVPPRTTGARWIGVLEGCLGGLLLTALWFTKMNYAAIGIVFWGLALVTRSSPASVFITCTISAPAWVLLFDHLSGITFAAMLADFRTVAMAQQAGSRLSVMVIQSIKFIPILPVLLLLTWERRNSPGAPAWRSLQSARDWMIPLVFFAAGILLISSNSQNGEIPLLGVAAFYGAEQIRRDTSASAEINFFSAVRNLGALCLLLLFVAPTLSADLRNYRNIFSTTAKRTGVCPDSFKNTCLADFRLNLQGSSAAMSRDFAAMMDEGMGLLRRHPRSQHALGSSDVQQPIPCGSGAAPGSRRAHLSGE